MSYRVDVPRRQQRVLDALPASERARVTRAIAELGHDPRPPGVKKLTGIPEWRIRVGDYRVIYSIWDRDDLVLITKIARRSETTYD